MAAAAIGSEASSRWVAISGIFARCPFATQSRRLRILEYNHFGLGSMRNIGICGGSSIRELGSVSDVTLFFDSVVAYAIPSTNRDWSLISDRLYKRYVRQEDLDETSGLMTDVKHAFSSVSSSAVDWSNLNDLSKSSSRLDSKQATLDLVFADYFVQFDYCVASAKIFYESWKIYQPVKVAISDIPAFMTDKKRPMAAYDALDGLPFWQQ